METLAKYRATGRRKQAVAIVWLFNGSGDIVVNKTPCDSYFLRETDRLILRQPLRVTNTLGKVNIAANVKGGGKSGQAQALRHGVSRALVMMDENLKPLLRKEGFLTRDPREKERKKYGQKGARKRFQWTKR
ncbi:MAG: 30S ribosomal protein S9 [Candidatus Omnitrophica bacterium]|nr:30S ribosomal protein S9 [Candidatus Omnitrophota bacterium]